MCVCVWLMLSVRYTRIEINDENVVYRLLNKMPLIHKFSFFFAIEKKVGKCMLALNSTETDHLLFKPPHLPFKDKSVNGLCYVNFLIFSFPQYFT